MVESTEAATIILLLLDTLLRLQLCVVVGVDDIHESVHCRVVVSHGCSTVEQLLAGVERSGRTRVICVSVMRVDVGDCCAVRYGMLQHGGSCVDTV